MRETKKTFNFPLLDQSGRFASKRLHHGPCNRERDGGGGGGEREGEREKKEKGILIVRVVSH